MTKEEAAHLSDVLKAYSEGREIECYLSTEKWEKVTNLELEIYPEYYRIKPKYRPYKDAEEFLKAQKEHGFYLISKRDKRALLPIIVTNSGVEMYSSGDHTLPTGYLYTNLLKYWEHQDGMPCGILEE